MNTKLAEYLTYGAEKTAGVPKSLKTLADTVKKQKRFPATSAERYAVSRVSANSKGKELAADLSRATPEGKKKMIADAAAGKGDLGIRERYESAVEARRVSR